MPTEETLVNRVENSGLITLDLEQFLPKESIEVFDLKEHLVNGSVLMEKHFRESLLKVNWQDYKRKTVGLCCSSDALIPMWAYMLVSSYLEPVAEKLVFGNRNEVESALVKEAIDNVDVSKYQDARVVVKGCGKRPIPASAFVEITKKLRPVTRSLMYGEPCSTVPVYKRPKQ